VKLLLIALLFTITVACSPIDLVTKALPDIFGDKGGINTELNVAGEVDKSIKVGQSTDIKAETVTMTTIVNENYSIGLLIVAIIGWLAPMPQEMWRWLKKRYFGSKK
jgi:hypothetical protein